MAAPLAVTPKDKKKAKALKEVNLTERVFLECQQAVR